MPAQATRDVREDRVPVLELDAERRARKDLGDGAEELERGFLRVGRRGTVLTARPRTARPPPSGYGCTWFVDMV
jgi:hypothetical protein